MTPFSLSDLGLSDDELAGLESASTPAPSAPSAFDEDEPTLSPFSLSDLGLSDEEMSELDSLQSKGSQPAPSAPDQPSFGELGMTSDESDDSGELPVDLQPFSFDDLDLNAESEPSSRIGGLPSSLQPFSLDEAPPQRPRVGGFGAPEAQESDASLDDEPDVAAEPRGFSWQQASQKSEPSFVKPPRPDPLVGDVSIFSKLKQQHNSQETRPEPPLPPVSLEPDEHMGLFSLDDISLRDDIDERALASASEPSAAAPPEPAKPAPEIENLEDALASGQVQPFSFADLGLSDEEIAALGMGAAAAAPPEPAKPAPEIENLEDALASGQVQPFSFADLGLSEEEQALLAGSTPEPPASAVPPEPAKPAPEIENLEDALSSGQVQPFSLSDLGLSDEEIAAMSSPGTEELGAAPAPEAPPQFEDFDVEPPAAPSTTQSDSGAGEDEPLLTADIQPFSLNDLGLSEEEIVSLGLDVGSSLEDTGDMSLGLTEEELEGLDGGDLHWAEQPAMPTTPPAQHAPAEQPEPPAEADPNEPQITTGDLVVDRLVALGRQQGYVDISDIIANFEDPEAEAARIEEIGMRLHEAKIEIRDGDEVIDMEAEYADEAEEMDEAAPEPPPPPRSSVSRDLDLVSDDFDVPALEAPAAEAPSEEPAMTPFSLSDLGLTEEEIAALGLGEAAPETAAPPAEEPATLEAATSEAPAAEAPSEVPAMTPCSLRDLGLTEDEISALGLC
jgi:uncharacterized protein YjiS (DUF1127 family)